MIVWQESFGLVLFIYKITNLFPRHELFGLTSQIRRASVSIPSNIAEGRGRKGDKIFAHFLKISQGSLFELITQVELAHRLEYIPNESYDYFIEKSNSISKMISVLIKKLSANS